MTELTAEQLVELRRRRNSGQLSINQYRRATEGDVEFALYILALAPSDSSSTGKAHDMGPTFDNDIAGSTSSTSSGGYSGGGFDSGGGGGE